jgi:O-antigen/teichoic acid export membrane protein
MSSATTSGNQTGADAAVHSTLQTHMLFGRIPVPKGSLPLITAVILSGLSAYAFLVLTARQLSPSSYAPLAAFWTLAFFVGPGIYVAVDQEMSRALSRCLTLGFATRPMARRVFHMSVLGTLGLLGIGGLLSPILLRRAFDDQGLLLAGFLLILPGYCLLSSLVGITNAFGRLRGSATVVAGEGIFRLAACAGLLVAGISTAGPYGLCVGIAPLAAAFVGWRFNRIPLTPGPPAPWRPVARGLTVLVGGTVLNQFLLVIEPFLVKIIAHTSDQAAAGRFLNAISLTRVPLFLFNAVIPVLLPRFTRLVEAKKSASLRRILWKLTLCITTIFAVATGAAVIFGPTLLRFLYGPAYVVRGWIVAALTAGAGLYCLATVLSLALIAKKSFLPAAVSWALGVGVMLLVTGFGGSLGLLGRATWGYVLGCAVSTAAMACFVAARPGQSKEPERP